MCECQSFVEFEKLKFSVIERVLWAGGQENSVRSKAGKVNRVQGLIGGGKY